MPLFSKVMMRLSPRVLRAIRIHLLLPMCPILDALPASGRVLDVGCGYGHVLSYLAERRPDLDFIGTDIDQDAVRQARAAWKFLPNVQFESVPVEELKGEFSHAMLLDVIHHMTPEQERTAIAAIASLLTPGGSILIKEMDAGKCGLGVFLDTYISRCPPTVRTHGEIAKALSTEFSSLHYETGRKGGIGFVNIRASVSKKNSGKSIPSVA